MTFRGIPAVKWLLIDKPYKDEFTAEINALMQEWDFIDCQFSTHYSNESTHYCALILLAKHQS